MRLQCIPEWFLLVQVLQREAAAQVRHWVFLQCCSTRFLQWPLAAKSKHYRIQRMLSSSCVNHRTWTELLNLSTSPVWKKMEYSSQQRAHSSSVVSKPDSECKGDSEPSIPANWRSPLPRLPNLVTSLPLSWKMKTQQDLLSTTMTWPFLSTETPLGPINLPDPILFWRRLTGSDVT